MKRISATIAAAVVLGLAQAAAAQPAEGSADLPKTSEVTAGGVLLLIPERTLTVSGGVSDKPALVTEAAAGPNPIPPIKSDPAKEGWVVVEGSPTMPPAGQLTFSMWVSEANGTVVRMLNATDSAIVYSANLVRRVDGELRVFPTTICAVKAGSWGVEHWPYPVAALQVTGMGKVDPGLCFDAATKSIYRVGQQPPAEAPAAAD